MIIDPKIQFDKSKRSFISRKTFDFLSTYFEYAPEKDRDVQDFEAFVYDFDRIKHFSDEDLCQATCYIVPFPYAFNNMDKAMTIYENLVKRNISQDKFINYTRSVTYPELAELSSEVINDVKWLLRKEEYKGQISSDAFNIHSTFSQGVEELGKYSKILGEFNKEKSKPFELEKIVSLNSTPVAMRFDETGALFVLDKRGVLEKFVGTQSEDSIKMPFDLSYVDSRYMGEFLDPGVTLLPMIFVKNDLLYFTSADGVQLFDLKELKNPESKEISKFKGSLAIGDKKYRYKFHDCVVKDDFALISYSNYEDRFVAAKTLDGSKIIYSSRFPRDHTGLFTSHWGCEEFTLRMDVHNGVLYMPGNNGISQFDGTELKEITKPYIAGGEYMKGIYPTTKFAFGKDFLVAMLRLKGTQYLTMGVFEPKYEAAGLIKEGDMVVPSSFEPVYMAPMPRISSPAMKHGTVAAHDNRFVVADPLFNELYFYRMSKSK